MQLQRHFVEKPWGRTDIPTAFGAPENGRIGEVWFETPDAEPLPILVKWLFTSEKLSIQVHPNDGQAQDRGRPSGKEECWYIIDAEPGAVLGIGTTEMLDVDQLCAASLSGDIEALIDWKPIRPGDYFYIPAGTVHAIGAGITLVEVQQYADITYRLYDYGRPRELHLSDGVAVSKPAPYADPRSGNANAPAQLVAGPHFDLWFAKDDKDPAQDRQRWVVPLSGPLLGQCLLVDAGEAIPACKRYLVAAIPG
jgi:mannose-6-phosphate isomerase